MQEHEFEPIGSSRTLKVDVRIIAATNRDLLVAVAEGRFRRDLYYRLNVFPIVVPPLRERAVDLPLLAGFFLQRFAKKFGKPVKRLAQDTLGRLAAYDWPGNIRELQNVIERGILLSPGETLDLAPDFGPSPEVPQFHSPEALDRRPEPARERGEPRNPTDGGWAADSSTDSSVRTGSTPGSLAEVERRHIQTVLQQTRWQIEGEGGAARILNLNPSTLRSRMKNLGLRRPESLG